MAENPDIVVIGGGTGSSTLLSELKYVTPNLASVVNMSDDGGSTGRLRRELGVLPTGDVRQCLVALSESPEMAERFRFRFGRDDVGGQVFGGSVRDTVMETLSLNNLEIYNSPELARFFEENSFEGHSLGNIMLAALEKVRGDFEKAVKSAGCILRITGEVIPVTLKENDLVLEDGKDTITGEYEIGHRHFSTDDVRVRLEPEAEINPKAKKAIEEAEMVVIAPGNLYGSLLPTLLVRGMKQALKSSLAKKVLVTNLVTQPGQTDKWDVISYIQATESYIGKDIIDAVLYNDAPISDGMLQDYALEGESPVEIRPERFSETSAGLYGADLLCRSIHAQDRKDTAIRRTPIRHDGERVAKALMEIYRLQ